MGGSPATANVELREPGAAFRRIEEWLRTQGFFAPGGEALVADLYLGYGLSETIRRTTFLSPPEPCRALPLAACSVRREPYPVLRYDNNTRVDLGDWEAKWASAEYAAAVECVRAAIERGDVYQVNLVQHLSAACAGAHDSIAHALAVSLASLRPLSPQPFVGDGWAVVSASPELFLSRRGRHLWTMPIKGTRPAGGAAELQESEKDAAEHVMIVDLERNDLSRVCEPGSVRWPKLMATHELAGVEHMVSTVEGTLRAEVGFAEILEATFPGGSVTGAPKVAAVDLIAELEPVGRGAAMGALGTVRGNGDFDLALTIRTFALGEGRLHLWVGGGVVWDSDPDAEVEESWTKARPLLEAIGTDVRTIEAIRA
jgi:para-aminobenzoate synthetase component 1